MSTPSSVVASTGCGSHPARLRHLHEARAPAASPTARKSVNSTGERGVAELELAGAIVKRVPAQVEAGAGAELEQPKRHAGLGRQPQEPARKRARAPHLVRLHRSLHVGSHLLHQLLDGPAEGGPGPFRVAVAAAGRVGGREVGRPSAQRQPVHRAHQAQLEHRLERVALVPHQGRGHRAARLGVVGGAAHQLAVQR